MRGKTGKKSHLLMAPSPSPQSVFQNVRRVRIFYDDPDTIDSSSDENELSVSGSNLQRQKQVVYEFTIPPLFPVISKTAPSAAKTTKPAKAPKPKLEPTPCSPQSANTPKSASENEGSTQLRSEIRLEPNLHISFAPPPPPSTTPRPPLPQLQPPDHILPSFVALHPPTSSSHPKHHHHHLLLSLFS